MDTTENTRRAMCEEINARQAERETLETQHGQCWNTTELQADFIVLAFSAPFVIVSRKSDNQRGSLEFQHSPRVYYGFRPE